MHIIRNSMDHGIEEPAERAAHGKQARGRITLKAFQESGSMVIECADDGRGLDLEKIAAKAKSLGLLPADRASSDEEIRNVVFAPGFSTSDSVSSVSGRGVGMDVVRKNVEALRGSVSLRSERNGGTAVIIRLPLTLAIIDGFIVTVGTTRFVIPLYSVTECLDVPHRDVHEDEGCAYIDLRGEALPFIRLEEIFGLTPDRAAKLRVVVVEHERVRTGLAVGSFIGENQIVVKPLGRLFSRHPWISGFTILGSGEVAPILDVLKLVPGSGTCHWTAMPEAPHLHREAGASSLHAEHN